MAMDENLLLADKEPVRLDVGLSLWLRNTIIRKTREWFLS